MRAITPLHPWLLAALALAAMAPVAAQELRLSTENDLFGNSTTKDDLYTFAVALSVERGPYTVPFRENAFTDRRAGVRFDESHRTPTSRLPPTRPWRAGWSPAVRWRGSACCCGSD